MTRLDISGATPDQKKDIMKYAAEFYKSEIDNFWKRSLFFWGFSAAAFIAYSSLYGKLDTGPIMPAIACFGLVASVAWSLLNRGSKYWYEAWEQKIAAIEMEALGAPLFTNVEQVLPGGWWGAARYSASKITVALSDFAALSWLILGLKTLPVAGLISSNCYILMTIIGTLLYLTALLWGCRSSSDPKIPLRPQSN